MSLSWSYLCPFWCWSRIRIPWCSVYVLAAGIEKLCPRVLHVWHKHITSVDTLNVFTHCFFEKGILAYKRCSNSPTVLHCWPLDIGTKECTQHTNHVFSVIISKLPLRKISFGPRSKGRYGERIWNLKVRYIIILANKESMYTTASLVTHTGKDYIL